MVHTARELSGLSGLPLPMVSKILGSLARAEIVTGHRGVGGGYRLAQDASEVTVQDVIAAIRSRNVEVPAGRIESGIAAGTEWLSGADPATFSA